MDGDPDLVRIDSNIAFDWGGDSPAEIISKNDFSARWRGYLKPYIPGNYSISISSDDGTRMWIEDSLVLDYWVPQPPTEHEFQYVFQDTNRQKIRIEYFEKGGGAEITLNWKPVSFQKEIIPRAQLFPMQFGNISGQVWIDNNRNKRYDLEDELLTSGLVLLINGKEELITHSPIMNNGTFSFPHVEYGIYLFQIIPDEEIIHQLIPGLNLDEYFRSEWINLSTEMTHVDFSFFTETTTSITVTDESSAFIYPNPTPGILNIVLKDDDQILDVQISDVQGNKMNVSQPSNGVVDCGFLPSGSYFLKLYFTDRIETLIFLKF